MPSKTTYWRRRVAVLSAFVVVAWVGAHVAPALAPPAVIPFQRLFIDSKEPEVVVTTTSETDSRLSVLGLRCPDVVETAYSMGWHFNDLDELDYIVWRESRCLPEGHYADDTMRQTVVPFRNAILLSVACGVAESAGAEGVVIAAHTGDHTIYPDCREDFMRAMADAMRMGTYAGVALLRPFIALDKGGIAALGARLGVDFAATYSCYKGGVRHCGACGTCVERREAFLQAGLVDPTAYDALPPLPERPAGAAS